jgi:hypothetical protein
LVEKATSAVRARLGVIADDEQKKGSEEGKFELFRLRRYLTLASDGDGE